MWSPVLRIEHRVEQPGEIARDPRQGVVEAIMLDGGDELRHALVELVDQEAVEPDAVIEQPHEGRAVEQRETGVAQRHQIVPAGLVLDHRPSPNQPPEPMPANVIALPSGEMALILMRPDTTPVQESSRSPRWQM